MLHYVIFYYFIKKEQIFSCIIKSYKKIYYTIIIKNTKYLKISWYLII